MPFGYSGPALAVGALSSAVGDYFKKQLESEMAIPQLQQTMEALNQMRLAGLQRQAMAPLQMAGAQQGLQRGAQELQFMPEQQQFQREAAARQEEQFRHMTGIQWPYEAQMMQRRGQAMADLKQRMDAQGGRPLNPEQMNQWVAQWGDALQGHPLAQHFKQYDPALAAQREARAKRDISWANWLDKGRPGMGNQGQLTPANTQAALTQARRQAEQSVASRLNEFKGIPNAELGNFGERQQIYDWMVDNEYRNILQQRGLGQHTQFLPPQQPMPDKLKTLMNMNVPGQETGGIGFINRAYNWLMGPTTKPEQAPQPQQSPQGFPKPAAGGWGIPQPSEPKQSPQEKFATNPQYHNEEEKDEEQ